MANLLPIALLIVLFPLLGAIIAGLFGKCFSKTTIHRVLISLIGLSFILACYLFKVMVVDNHPIVDDAFYTWATSGQFKFHIGFLIDRLSVIMSIVVLFVSLMVHIYTIGYMADDPGYTRFFSYVSLFTFSMLVLVFANNFLLLFFGWEGVGLVSYLLIGFWFEREAANRGSFKAFLVNRVGDLAFILAIAAILMYFGTLNYQTLFLQVPALVNQTISIFPQVNVPMITLVCTLLFIGAMGKSAQVPLHVWLPESMEGPTPISALIHAATMVTAGIYMVARLSPLFEYAPSVLSLILVIGGTTAFFMGLVGMVQFDIKRVIAYSTISQLGYMAVALGASAYDAAIFHLVTHAFFKALLFLAAGSVIVAMHHEQDMRKMGGLASYLPITYLTFMIGALALSAIPPFSGFYSKDLIIEAAKYSQLPGARYAYFCLLAGAFVTPFYIFRALFMTFHTKERMSQKLKKEIHETPWVILLPLLLLAIPSVIAGQLLVNDMIFATKTFFGDTLFVLPEHNVIAQIGKHYEGAKLMALKAGDSLTFWFSLAGIFASWLFIVKFPSWSDYFKTRFSGIYRVIVNKYGFDAFYQNGIVKGARETGTFFFKVTDLKLIDGLFVNGSGLFVRWLAQTSKRLQSGYLYHYALVMIIGVSLFLIWTWWR